MFFGTLFGMYFKVTCANTSFATDGGMAKEWSADPLEIPLGPITRARAKRFKEALNVLIQDSQAEGAHGLNSKKKTKLVHVIKVNPNLDQELRRF